jgi:DNA polymerase III subunit beta
MQASIEKNDFYKSIAAVLGVVDRKCAMPILGHVLLEANGDGVIKVSATDLEVTYQGFCPARIKTQGAVTVPAHQLATLIKDIPQGDVEVEATENHGLRLAQGEMKYRIHGLDPEQFPPLPGLEEGVGFVEIPSAAFKEMIKRVIFATSLNDLQYHLSSVLFENLGGEALRLVSSDGHRLSLAEHAFPLMGLLMGETGIQVPRKGVFELLRFAEHAETVSLAVHEQVFIARSGDRTMTIKLLDKRFPDYRRIIPAWFAVKWTFNRVEMFQALKRLSLLSTERFKGVIFNPEEGRVVLKSENADVGHGLEIVPWTEETGTPPAPLPGEEQQAQDQDEAPAPETEPEPPPDFSAFGFNIKYLLDPLAVMTSETVELAGIAPNRPFKIRAAGDDSFFSLVMPMDV